MENYVLYHEIYKKDGMIMYKGRKKGTITYVAISCIEKDQRIKVTNHVRIVYDLVDKHVVRFYEWYETSNHLWLVTDLCVGGSLQQMLIEDTSFPESSIKSFGAHLIRGLHYLHSRDIVCVQWHPSKIVLDGGGTLKFFDFSDSKKINEDYDDLVQRFFSGLNIEPRDIEELFDYRRPTAYTAPEVLQGAAPDFLSDIWGLGCLLFEMHTGRAPFGGGGADEIVESVLHSPLIIPTVRGTRLSGRASQQLADVLERMLHKNRDSRISLEQLWQHPFWQGALGDLVQHRQQQQQHLSSRPSTAFAGGDQHKLSVPDDGPDNSSSCASLTMSAADDASFVLHLGSRGPVDAGAGAVSEDATVTGTPTGRTGRNQFQLDPVTEPAASQPLPGVPAEHKQLMEIATSSASELSRGKAHIDDYSRLMKDGRAKFDGKLLAIPTFSVVKLRGMRKTERDKHLRQVESAIKTGEKGPPSQRRLHLINYLAQLAMVPEVSNYMVECGVAAELCRQIRVTSSQELIVRTCQAVAVLLHHQSSVSASLYNDIGGDMLAILADTLRDHFRCSRVKIAALTALGEALVQLTDYRGGGDDGRQTDEPVSLGQCVTLLNRCLHRSEEVGTNLVAARTIEIVASRCGPVSAIGRQLASIETLQQLFNCYKHATVDQLKTSATLAMSRLTRLDSLQLCALLDRVGSAALLENVHVALLAVQEAVLEMLAVAMLLQPSVTAVRKLGQDTGFLRGVMRLLETPAPLVRAKALLLVLLLCRTDVAQLRAATADHRLVLYLERELKRVSGGGGGGPGGQGQFVDDAMEHCLRLFTAFLGMSAVPAILGDCCGALAAVQGRKHPSSMQAKALRAALPMLECVTTLASSPSLRAHIFCEQPLCGLLGQLLGHAVRIDSGQTSLGAADSAPQFLTHVLALVEAASHCVDMTSALLLEHVLQPLACLTGSTGNADIRIIGLKLCGDIVNAIVLSDELDSNFVDKTPLSSAVEGSLFPQMHQFIIDPDPSAVYLLRLLRNYVQVNPDQCIAAMRKVEFSQLLVKLLVDHQQRIMAAVVLECLMLVSAIAQVSPELLRDCILDAELVAHLCDTLFEIGDVYHKDEMSLRTPKTSELLQTGLEGLCALAKLISDLVKRAMKSKRSQENEEAVARLTSEAEELLVKGKPLTETVDLLIYTMGSAEADTEVVDASIKLLHQVVSLYGGQQIHHALNEANVQLLCGTLLASPGTQHVRTILRILKRLLASGQLPSSAISGMVRDAVATVTCKLDMQSDTVCQGIVNEIGRCLDN